MSNKLEPVEKKQLLIFTAVAFGVPYLMGIAMGVNYYRGVDVSIFPNAQMYYPAAGAMLALLMTKKKEQKLPVKYYTCFLVLTGLMAVLSILSVVLPDVLMGMLCQLVIVFGSAVSWIFYLIEKKELRRQYYLGWGCPDEGADPKKRSADRTLPWLLIALFLCMYFLRIFASFLLEGEPGAFVQMFAGPYVWISLLVLPFNFFLVYTAFFGEEYGWRGFLQPLLQKRFGLRGGVLILGVVWGLWHLPINVFYYSPQTWLQSILAQQLTCIGIGIFFGMTMLKTRNIWTVVVMHYLNNNLIAVLAGTADVISGQVISWLDILILLAANGVFYASFIASRAYRKGAEPMKIMGEETEAPECFGTKIP